ncbi:ribbon-helix-helix protein, CopG family [Jonesiaceae bacterium BS-20]|uniref:Ribbon-helix-helix protein, CopG family n=1 Tax=Jonesiaceae bacterium BS-20 TaxID=3120821 RepID=A0AAU7DW66_9MICO
MKTAISLPDDTFDRASQRAKDLGLSRSEFFARAANYYLAELDAESMTAQINSALEQIDAPEDSSLIAVQSGHSFLADSSTEW